MFVCITTYAWPRKGERLDLPYRTAIGARFSPLGASLKINSLYRKRSTEFIGYFSDGFVGSVLYYWNFTLDKNAAFRLYVGGGAQAGYKKQDGSDDAFGGAVGVVGLDYKIPKVPINISADWQPAYRFGDVEGFNGNYGGLAVRLCF